MQNEACFLENSVYIKDWARPFYTQTFLPINKTALNFVLKDDMLIRSCVFLVLNITSDTLDSPVLTVGECA